MRKMKIYIKCAALILVAGVIASCFPVNHFKLVKRYRNDAERYEEIRSSGNHSGGQGLVYVAQYLDEARKANRRWDNQRARTMLELCEELLIGIENPAAVPTTLVPIYERAQPAEPQD